MRARLGEAYIWVRKNIFPEWDQNGGWKIKQGHGPAFEERPQGEWQEEGADYQGECDRENKCIYIALPYLEGKSNSVIRGIIVHEIAHAISSDSHKTGEWPREMEKAAKRARDMGGAELADFD